MKINEIKLEKGIIIPSRSRNHKPTQYQILADKLEKGHSFEVPISNSNVIAMGINNYIKQRGLRIAIRTNNKKTARLFVIPRE